MFTKIIAASVGIAIISSTALADGTIGSSMEQAIIVEEVEAANSNRHFIVPLILIAFIAAGGNHTGGAVALSDTRTKTDIVPVGAATNGQPLYQYRYIGSEIVFEGVMAQDVLQHSPEAVITLPEGIMMVDYGMLGLCLRVVG
jgi:hypothetical protein